MRKKTFKGEQHHTFTGSHHGSVQSAKYSKKNITINSSNKDDRKQQPLTTSAMATKANYPFNTNFSQKKPAQFNFSGG